MIYYDFLKEESFLTLLIWQQGYQRGLIKISGWELRSENTCDSSNRKELKIQKMITLINKQSLARTKMFLNDADFE